MMRVSSALHCWDWKKHYHNKKVTKKTGSLLQKTCLFIYDYSAFFFLAKRTVPAIAPAANTATAIHITVLLLSPV